MQKGMSTFPQPWKVKHKSLIKSIKIFNGLLLSHNKIEINMLWWWDAVTQGGWHNFFASFLNPNLAKTYKSMEKEFLTCIKSAQHPKAGQNIQHLLFKCVLYSDFMCIQLYFFHSKCCNEFYFLIIWVIYTKMHRKWFC